MPNYASFSRPFGDFGIAIIDPETARFVFETKFESFKKGKRVAQEMEEMLGDGIFASDPPKWYPLHTVHIQI